MPAHVEQDLQVQSCVSKYDKLRRSIQSVPAGTDLSEFIKREAGHELRLFEQVRPDGLIMEFAQWLHHRELSAEGMIRLRDEVPYCIYWVAAVSSQLTSSACQLEVISLAPYKVRWRVSGL